MQTKKRLLTFILSIVSVFALCSCTVTTAMCPLGTYEQRYNAVADEFHFYHTDLILSATGVTGFAAFDGLFIVCLCTTEDGMIYSADISTGTEYAKKIKNNDDEFQNALLSAAYLVAPFYLDSVTKEEISKIGGMILASLDDEVEVTKGITLNSKRTSGGGFEITVSLIG